MKYTAKQMHDGQWSVFAGRRFFSDFVYDNHRQAQERAYILSMQWYHRKVEETWDKMITAQGADFLGAEESVILVDGTHATKSDLLC